MTTNLLKHIPKLLTISLGCLAILVVLASCESPLDVDTPRVNTPITPAVLAVPSRIDAEFTNSNGRFVMDGTPTIRVDTTVSPMRIWMDLRMRHQAQQGGTPTLLRFRVRLDSVAIDPHQMQLTDGMPREMMMDLVDTNDVEINNVPAGANSPATMLITEPPRLEDGKRRLSMLLYVRVNAGDVLPGFRKEYVFGEINVVF
jgi:hypothetical protein